MRVLPKNALRQALLHIGAYNIGTSLEYRMVLTTSHGMEQKFYDVNS